jgi:hypothetical protein
MRHVVSPPLSAILLLMLAMPPCQAVPIAGPDQADDERLLESVGLSTRGPDLLEFFRKLTPPAERALKPEQVAALVRRLGDGDFKVRAGAANESRVNRRAISAAPPAAASSAGRGADTPVPSPPGRAAYGP